MVTIVIGNPVWPTVAIAVCLFTVLAIACWLGMTRLPKGLMTKFLKAGVIIFSVIDLISILIFLIWLLNMIAI